MENTGHSDRELICNLSAEGKTAEQQAAEAWQAVQVHRAAKARGEPFQPVLDLRPEDLSQQQGRDFRMDADPAQAQEVVVDRIGGIWARHPQRGWGYITRGDSGEDYLWDGWLDQPGLGGAVHGTGRNCNGLHSGSSAKRHRRN